MSLPQPERGSTTSTPPGTPRWVKVSGIIALALILLFVIIMFAFGGEHGPGRHLPSGGDGTSTSPRVQRVHQL